MSGQIRFGVEFEMVVRPKDETIPMLEDWFEFSPRIELRGQREKNREAIIKFLQAYMGQAGLLVNDFDAEKKIGMESDYTT